MQTSRFPTKSTGQGSEQHAVRESTQKEKRRKRKPESLAASQPQDSGHHHHRAEPESRHQRPGLSGILRGQTVPRVEERVHVDVGRVRRRGLEDGDGRAFFGVRQFGKQQGDRLQRVLNVGCAFLPGRNIVSSQKLYFNVYKRVPPVCKRLGLISR